MFAKTSLVFYEEPTNPAILDFRFFISIINEGDSGAGEKSVLCYLILLEIGKGSRGACPSLRFGFPMVAVRVGFLAKILAFYNFSGAAIAASPVPPVVDILL